MGVDHMSVERDVSRVTMATVRLSWREPYAGPPAPHLLRGALAQRFSADPLFHQHEGDGATHLLYRYPQIHYRWERGDGLVVGFGGGAQALLAVPWPSLSLRLGEREVTVLEATATLAQHVVRPTATLRRYRFRAPWLPFNQANYERYRRLDPAAQAEERDRLAVAGLLMAMRGLGITFPERLYAAVVPRRACTCRYKDQEFLGFTGDLLANVDLPDGFALGRAVSHGYGWVSRLLGAAEG